MYLVKTPWWLRRLYPTLTWQLPTDEKVIYLTFDDGPHETATPFVLDTLQRFNAKATFFCIGKNVSEQRNIYERIIAEGHAVGNHTYNHLNGWKTHPADYFKDISYTAQKVHSNLFRPPYGRITKQQIRELQNNGQSTIVNSQLQDATSHHSPFTTHYSIIMWSVLSGDFDISLRKEKCLSNVIKNSGKGSIVVFHDSAKAFDRMSYALPKALEHFSKQGFSFKAIPYQPHS